MWINRKQVHVYLAHFPSSSIRITTTVLSHFFLSQYHKAQFRMLHVTQSLVRTLNSNERLLEADQQPLKKKKKRILTGNSSAKGQEWKPSHSSLSSMLHGHNTINILCHYEVQWQICILSQTQSQPVIVALISADITCLTYKSFFFLIVSGNMTLLNTVLILFCLTM